MDNEGKIFSNKKEVVIKDGVIPYQELSPDAIERLIRHIPQSE